MILDQRMRFYTTERLGPNQYETPEGYLLVKDVPLARTGVQVYGPGEVPVEPGPDGRVLIDRDPDEVFRPETLASFNLKPFVDDHPPVDVTPENWRSLARGVIHDPRRGEGIQDDLMLGDILITCPQMIDAVKAGRIREVSAGYDADYEQTGPGRGRQYNIVGNHMAGVEQGRCGPRCAIGDAVLKPGRLTPGQYIDEMVNRFHTDDGRALLPRRVHRQKHIHIHL